MATRKKRPASAALPEGAVEVLLEEMRSQFKILGKAFQELEATVDRGFEQVGRRFDQLDRMFDRFGQDEVESIAHRVLPRG